VAELSVRAVRRTCSWSTRSTSARVPRRPLRSQPIVPAAAQIGGTTLRSLDAIHLATAPSISAELGTLITYDNRMISDSQALGLPVLSPA
jgi:hypothetical protein